MMNTELGGNGMRAPMLDKMIAKNLRFEFLTNGQSSSPSIQCCHHGDLGEVCRVAAVVESRV
jgi:hypothetical protein